MRPPRPSCPSAREERRRVTSPVLRISTRDGRIRPSRVRDDHVVPHAVDALATRRAGPDVPFRACGASFPDHLRRRGYWRLGLLAGRCLPTNARSCRQLPSSYDRSGLGFRATRFLMATFMPARCRQPLFRAASAPKNSPVSEENSERQRRLPPPLWRWKRRQL